MRAFVALAIVCLVGGLLICLTAQGVAVIPANGQIGDYVWLDADRDGIQDVGETGISGVVVKLQKLLPDGSPDGPIVTTTTDATGLYLFPNLGAGTYVVSVDSPTVPSGDEPTLPNMGGDSARDSDNPAGTTVTLPTDSSVDLTIDFGYYVPCSGRIGDYVWLDANHNGIQDDGNTGIGGVVVNLEQPAGTIIATTETDATGHYVFEGLCAGTYVVSVDSGVPAGAEPTLPNMGGDSTLDSDNPVGTTVTLAADNSSDLTIDFGYYVPPVCTGRIGDYVWLDANHNGIQDDGNTGISNVVVKLRWADGTIMTTTTDATGYYVFEGLCRGTYLVWVDSGVPSGDSATSLNVGTNPAVDSDNPAGTTVTLAADNSSDMTIDFGYFATGGGEICTTDPANPSGTIVLGTLDVSIAPNGDVTVIFTESTNINDNTYGTNTVNWPRSHNFSDLVGSDEAQFRFKDATGNVVFEFCLDYISQISVAPGYASLGLSGGDGKLLKGQASWLLDYGTSLADNFATFCPTKNYIVNGVNLTQNSPPTSPTNTYNAVAGFEAWQFPIIYRVTVSAAAFGAAGFGGVTIPLVHNSPPKIGTNAASEVPCVPGGGGGGTTCSVCKGGVTSLTLQYLGTADTTLVVYEGKDRKPDKILYQGTVSPSGTFSFVGIRADHTMGGEISIWVGTVRKAIITTSCTKPIGPGLVVGDFKVIDGTSKDGGTLCAVP